MKQDVITDTGGCFCIENEHSIEASWTSFELQADYAFRNTARQ